MKHIISANYLDRNSPYRWLVRREDQTPKQAVACKAVKAVNVQFVYTDYNSPESALGCVRVAVTSETPVIEGVQPPPAPTVRLSFSGGSFIVNDGEKRGQEITSAKELNLAADGGMHAVL